MKLFAKNLLAVTIGVGTLISTTATFAAPMINGSGATFPTPIYTKWASDYRGATGVTINYQGTGSSAGIDAMKKRTVDFGGTDDPLSSAQLNEAGLVQFPSVIGGVVPVYHIEGLNKTLTLNGAVLGDIFLNKITKWNDPAIVKLNSGVNLPDADIRVVRRSDGSGTSYVFSDYLTRTNSSWKTLGASKTPKWGTNTLGGKGNDGVAAQVKQLNGSIGYVEYAFAKKNGLLAANLINRDGKVVAPSASSFTAAANKANWSNTVVELNNVPGANSWPITAATYIIMPKSSDKTKSVEVLRFFEWAMTKGQGQAMNLEYIPLPTSVYQKVKASIWKSMTDQATGQSII
ncbi:MAG: pstS [Burkholderiaceae bacterium]|nr:pstS [Burkholderiaceae bacterium]